MSLAHPSRPPTHLHSGIVAAAVAEQQRQEERAREGIEGSDDDGDASQLCVAPITLQSFTFSELWFRCCASYQQVKKGPKGQPVKGMSGRLWHGVGVNLD